MKLKALLLALAACSIGASVATAQPAAPAPTTSKTFTVAGATAPQVIQEYATVLRTVLDVRDLTTDPATSTVTVTGSADLLIMVDWLTRELNSPPAAPKFRNVPMEQIPVPASLPAMGPGPRDEAVRVFFLAHTKTPQAMQELLTTLRTVADVQKVFNYTLQTALVVRAPTAQMALVAYLIGELDAAPGSPHTAPEFPFAPPVGPASVVRVFFLSHATSPAAVQQILTALRTVVGIMKVFNNTALASLTVRGTSADLAASDWLIRTLDSDPGSNAQTVSPEYRISGAAPNDDTIRVFYSPRSIGPAGIQQYVSLLRTQQTALKVSSFASPTALIVRGSASQLTQAEQSLGAGDWAKATTP